MHLVSLCKAATGHVSSMLFLGMETFMDIMQKKTENLDCEKHNTTYVQLSFHYFLRWIEDDFE